MTETLDVTPIDSYNEVWKLAEENWNNGKDEWIPITDKVAEALLGVLPPIYIHGGFVVDEPYTHNSRG